MTGAPASPVRCETVAAIVPAFDEQGRVGTVVAGLLRTVGRVLVVDDGSRDATAGEAGAAGAEVIRHPHRQGKGAAVRSGLEAIAGGGHRYVLLIDADGQHDPEDAGRFLAAAERHGYDLVVGHRRLDGAGRASIRDYANLVACNMLSRWVGHEIMDSQSGFRLFRAGALDGIRLEARGFEIETEMLLKLCRGGARVGYVQVRGAPPTRKSRLRPVRDVTRICFSAVRYQYLGD